MVAASPITTGRHTSRISASARDFVTISGPLPAGSPIVIASRGFFASVIDSPSDECSVSPTSSHTQPQIVSGQA